MISFREIGYWGRLGNQMFQFASTVGIARKSGFDAKFPIENCFVSQRTGPYDPEIGQNEEVKCDLLDCFNLSDDFFIPARHIRTDRIYQEPDFTFDPNSFKIPNFTSVRGYFQTEKYFSHCSNEIKKNFSFKKEILEKAQEYVQKIKEKSGKSLIGVHVRRGDYVRSPDHHPPCSFEYYKRCFDLFNRIGEFIFLIFSDDPSWCEDNFKGENYIVCNLKDPYQELCCMSLCSHNIIANSSYSWWGAWLNNNRDKKILAPSKWFGPLLNKNTDDVYCHGWIKL